MMIAFPGGETGGTVQQATDSTTLSWIPSLPLPLQSSCTVRISGLTDYLGQPLETRAQNFSSGGLQGINLYRDANFSLRIASDQLELPIAFVEIAASSTAALSGRTFILAARTGTQASMTLQLPLLQPDLNQGRFRCRIDFETVKNLPGYAVPLLPGEWLELSSPELTSDRKILYYRFSGATSPDKIIGLQLFQEKDFAQPLVDVLPLASLYIQIEAEDLNWFTTDTTRVRITSDIDKKGFSLALTEAGTHSSFFRGMIQIDQYQSNENLNRIVVHPGQRLRIESETDPSVWASVRYLPENGLRLVSAFPSPVRNSSLFFRFYLNFPGDVEIEIFDTAGHEVDSMTIRGREGENRHEWRLPRHLANGAYFYIMKLTDSTAYPTSKRKYRGKFAVLR